MALCRFVLLSTVLFTGRAVVVAMDLHEQRLMEAPTLLRGGASMEEVKIIPPPAEVLRSPQFSSLLDAYTEDTALERALGECRLWIDVERFRASETTGDPPKPASDVTERGESRDTASFPQHTMRPTTGKGRCASLNKRFGWTVRSSSGSFEDSFSSAVCTEAPWFADIEVVKVDYDGTDELNLGDVRLHVKYIHLPQGDPSQDMAPIIPMAPFQILTPSGDDGAGPPRPGEKSIVFCLEKGQPVLLSRPVENETAYLGECKSAAAAGLHPSFVGRGFKLSHSLLSGCMQSVSPENKERRSGVLQRSAPGAAAVRKVFPYKVIIPVPPCLSSVGVATLFWVLALAVCAEVGRSMQDCRRVGIPGAFVAFDRDRHTWKISLLFVCACLPVVALARVCALRVPAWTLVCGGGCGALRGCVPAHGRRRPPAREG